MIRPLAILVALSGPAAAQGLGPCQDGALWWSASGTAGYGPCESPQEGFFLISCRGDRPILEVESPFDIAEGAPGQLTLAVDGAVWPLSGVGTLYPRTGMGLGAIDLPEDTLRALIQGRAAQFTLPEGARDIHLTGSGAALATMLQGCGGS